MATPRMCRRAAELSDNGAAGRVARGLPQPPHTTVPRPEPFYERQPRLPLELSVRGQQPKRPPASLFAHHVPELRIEVFQLAGVADANAVGRVRDNEARRGGR